MIYCATCVVTFLRYSNVMVTVQNAIHRLHVLSPSGDGKKSRIPDGSALTVLSGGRKRMQPTGSSLLALATGQGVRGTIAGRTATTGLLRSTLHAMPVT